jgi:ABC-type Fe3+-hydroxamate transport system substrate-binding protein
MLKPLKTIIICLKSLELWKEEKAQLFNLKIYDVLNQQNLKPYKGLSYLENPYMTIGSDTFIHKILSEIGFENIFKIKPAIL